MKRLMILLSLMGVPTLYATSYCYKQRSNCFVVDDKKSDIRMFSKRDVFIAAAKKHGISKKEIEAMIKRGEGRSESEERREDLRDSRGYYGGVYWPHPIYAYPPYYWDDDDHHPHHPDRPHKPEKPVHGPVAIQPTENPYFDRPHGPHKPSTKPQRPSTRPVQSGLRPITRPRPRPVQRPRPRPRPMRRAR